VRQRRVQREEGGGVWGEGEREEAEAEAEAEGEEEVRRKKVEEDVNARGAEFGWDFADTWGGAEWRKEPGTPWILTQTGQVVIGVVIVILIILTLAEQWHIKQGGLPWIDLSANKDWAQRRDAAAADKAAKAALV